MADKQHYGAAVAAIDFTRNLFKTLAARFGGDTTLNELRVMNQIILCHFAGRSCSVTALHKVTGIPIPTVSRSVANLQSDGWLSERRDPADGRRRIISLGRRYLEQTSADCYAVDPWINDFRKQSLSA